MMALTNSNTIDGGQTLIESHSSSAPSIVSRAYDESDGTIEDAVERLYQLATRDPDFLKEKLPSILRTWCQERIGTHVSKIRFSSWTSTTQIDASQRGARLREAVKTLMDFPLPVSGIRLGDASADQVREAAQHYLETAQDAAWKARWLTRVADAAGNANRISSKITVEQLESLQEEEHAH